MKVDWFKMLLLKSFCYFIVKFVLGKMRKTKKRKKNIRENEVQRTVPGRQKLAR